jgi:all-trans-retinol 13,14-reductase
MRRVGQVKAMPPLIGKLMSWLPGYSLPKKVLDSSYNVLRGITDNEKLIAVLCGQWGDHGCPPKESVFLMHALIAGHYFNGGFYPVGGASKMAETIIPQIQSGGGDVFTYADVKEIIVADNRATGVRMADGHCLYAPTIISNAGVVNTFDQLLPSAVSEKLGYRQKVTALDHSMSHLGMYIGLKGTAEELQLPKTNLWIYLDQHHDKNVAAIRQDPSAPLPLVYVSFPSAKDPDFQRRYPGRSTIEIVSGPCDYEQYGREIPGVSAVRIMRHSSRIYPTECWLRCISKCHICRVKLIMRKYQHRYPLAISVAMNTAKPMALRILKTVFNKIG